MACRITDYREVEWFFYGELQTRWLDYRRGANYRQDRIAELDRNLVYV